MPGHGIVLTVRLELVHEVEEITLAFWKREQNSYTLGGGSQ